MPLACGTKFLRFLIFAIFSAIRKNRFPQINITAKIFPAKIYSRANAVFSNLNLLHKNTVPRNGVCSITTGLFLSETNTDAHLVLFENMSFYRTYENIINADNAGYWVLSEIEKLNPQQEKTVCPLLQKLDPAKYQKSQSNPQK